MDTTQDTLHANRYPSTTACVADAIRTSQGETRIVYIDAGRYRDAILAELERECDVSNQENDGSEDFAGVDIDGDTWRVRVL